MVEATVVEEEAEASCKMDVGKMSPISYYMFLLFFQLAKHTKVKDANEKGVTQHDKVPSDMKILHHAITRISRHLTGLRATNI